MLVNFKRGSQSSLNTLLTGIKNGTATAVPGSFYLTEDTNRLYFAQDATHLEHLNQYVHIWENSGLPTVSSGVEPGDIYYLKNDNILAVYTEVDGSNVWRQLNPDTFLVATTSAVAVSSSATNNVNVVTTVRDMQGEQVQHIATGKFNLIGGTNVSITNNGNDITIAATDTNTTYGLSAATADGKSVIRLSDNASTPNNYDVPIIGDGGITVSHTANSVVISGSNPVTGVSNSFSATGVFQTALTVSGSNPIKSIGIVPTIEYGGGETKETAIFDGTVSGSPKASLDVYTTGEVDSLINQKLASADAMTFKGVKSTDAELLSAITATGVNAAVVGDVYKIGDDIELPNTATGTASDNVTYNIASELRGKTLKTGDLLIAGGTDTNVVWSIVPSGDDQMLSLVYTANSNAITLNDSVSHTSLGTFRLAQDSTSGNSVISISSSVNSTNNTLTTTIAHGLAGAGVAVSATAVTNATTQGTDTNFDVPIVTGISKDVHGHITDVALQTYRFTDTHASLKNISISTDATNNRGLYTASFGLEDKDGVLEGQLKSMSLYLSSQNLTISKITTGDAANKGFDISLEWDSF